MSFNNFPLYLEPIPGHRPVNNTLFLVSLRKFLQSTSVCEIDKTKEDIRLTTSNLIATLDIDDMMNVFSIDNELVC